MSDDPFDPPADTTPTVGLVQRLGTRNLLFLAGAVLGTTGIVFSVPALAVVGFVCWIGALLLAYSKTLGLTGWLEGFFED